MMSTDFGAVVSPLISAARARPQGALRRARGGRTRGYAVGGPIDYSQIYGAGPFGGPGWALPYSVPGALTPITAPPGGALLAALQDPFAFLANPNRGGDAGNGSGDGGSGGGTGGGGGASSGSSSSSGGAPSGSSGGVSPAGVSGQHGIGSVAAAGLGALGSLAGVPPGVVAGINNAVKGIQSNAELSAENAPNLGFMDVVKGMLNDMSFGIFGKDINVAAEEANNSTNAAKGIGVPTSSVDFADKSAPAPAPSSDAPEMGHGESDAPGGGDSDGGEGGTGGGGCFTGDTEILMADGSLKDIAEVRVGDMVMAFDHRGPLEPCRVVQTFVHHSKPTLMIDGCQTTAEHPFLATDGCWHRAQHIQPGWGLITATGEPWVVQSVRGNQALETVYNLEVDRLHTYVAAGFRVHNKFKGGRVEGALSRLRHRRRRRGGALSRLVA